MNQTAVTAVATQRRIGSREIVIVALCSALYAGLGILGAIFTFAPGGVTLFYLPEIFILPAAIWFGVWGMLGAGFGTLLFSPYFGYGFLPGLLVAAADLLSPGIVGFTVKTLKVDTVMRSKKAFAVYALACLIGAAVEAVAGEWVLVAIGLTTVGAIPYGALVWWVGDITAGLILAPILLRALTPFFKRSGLYYDKFFSVRRGSSIIEG